MRVLVIGSTGCIGSAVAQALRMRGHRVIAAARSLGDGEHTRHVDFMQPRTPHAWATCLRDAQVDAVVNAVGILIPSRSQSFERVHAQGPIELFRGAALAGVRRVIQVSALGVGESGVDMPYLATKLAADDALQALAAQHHVDHAGVGDAGLGEAGTHVAVVQGDGFGDADVDHAGFDYAIVRPSLVHGPGSSSAALFATLASLPVISLPGRGGQPVQPVHVYEVAEAITRLLETREPVAGVFELAGPKVLSYRAMLAAYRRSLGLGEALWLPLPMAAMKLGAWFAEALPQKVFARDTLRLLERGSVATDNAAPSLLRRRPTSLDDGLRVTPPTPMLDLRVELSPRLAFALRASVAFLWLYTAAITLLRPQGSGVLALLARCGFEGDVGVAVMVASCALNMVMGAAMLRRPGPWAYAMQLGAVLGYTLTAAVAMPELTLDHCGALAKNLPLLGLLVTLWCSRAPRPSLGRASQPGAGSAARVRLERHGAHAARAPRAAQT